MTYEHLFRQSQEVQAYRGHQERRGKKGIPEGGRLHQHQQPGQPEKWEPRRHDQPVGQRQGQPAESKRCRPWWSCRGER